MPRVRPQRLHELPLKLSHRIPQQTLRLDLEMTKMISKHEYSDMNGSALAIFLLPLLDGDLDGGLFGTAHLGVANLDAHGLLGKRRSTVLLLTIRRLL